MAKRNKQRSRDCDRTSGENIIQEMDRFSNLPESIICHIFSFLPTESVVRTGVLSKSWKDRWCRATSFDFNNERWSNKHKYSSKKRRSEMPRMNFVEFVHMILQKQSPGLSIDRFSMILRNFKSASVSLHTWIKTAVSRNLCVLDLEVDYDYTKYTMDRCGIQLPASLFTCETLENLKLSHPGVCIKVPCVVSLPKLRNLELLGVVYESGQTVNRLILGCSRLQSMKIIRGVADDLLEFAISSPTLKSIEYSRHSWIGSNKELVIDTPVLESLSINQSGVENEFISVKRLCCLVKARVSLCRIAPDMAFEVLGAFVSVKILNLSGSTMSNVVTASKRLSAPFKKLGKLTVIVHKLSHLNCLIQFIDCCPALEILTVENVSGFEEEESWKEPTKVPKCILSNVKEVFYKGFLGKEIEFEMLKYISKYGLVLENFDVSHSSGCHDQHLQSLKKIFKLKESLRFKILRWC